MHPSSINHQQPPQNGMYVYLEKVPQLPRPLPTHLLTSPVMPCLPAPPQPHRVCSFDVYRSPPFLPVPPTFLLRASLPTYLHAFLLVYLHSLPSIPPALAPSPPSVLSLLPGRPANLSITDLHTRPSSFPISPPPSFAASCKPYLIPHISSAFSHLFSQNIF